MMKTLSVYSHPTHHYHDYPRHPETASRLISIQQTLPELAKSIGFELIDKEIRASNDVLGLAHTQSHINTLVQRCQGGRGNKGNKGNIDGDTYYCSDSSSATDAGAGAGAPFGTRSGSSSSNAINSESIARCSVGGVIELANRIVSSQTSCGFALVRPPGHHATPSRAMGFCFYSTLAIASLYLLARNPTLKVAILDFDVHHGNGTQDCIAGNKNVLFISTHQEHVFPGTGKPDNSYPNIINLPLIAHTNDREYQYIVENIIFPSLAHFAPDILLVSAGYDAHHRDPLAQLSLTSRYYGFLTHQLMRFCHDTHCRGPLYSLEGGYHIPSLEESLIHSFRALANPEYRSISDDYLTGLSLRKEHVDRVSYYRDVFARHL